ncbi:MAG: transporter, putative metabolite:H+ symporter [Acidimicrobiaceae bacterium]|jgi:MFS family permease
MAVVPAERSLPIDARSNLPPVLSDDQTEPTGWRIARLNSHEYRVLLPLAFVGFFTNYDLGLLTLAAPALASGLHVSIGSFGVGVAIIRLAAIGSVGTLRLADRWGRRRMLLATIIVSTIATASTAAAAGLVAFVVCQVVSRMFLATEEALAAVVLTEELRPDRRGAGLSLLGVVATPGFGLVAVLLLVVDSTTLGWRLFYVVALIPLALVAYLRRNLNETRAFVVASDAKRVQQRWWPAITPADRSNLLRLSIIFGLVGMLDTTAFFYAADLAQADYGWSGLFTLIVFAAAPATLLGFVVGGKVSDRIGRKPITLGAVIAFAVGAIVVFTRVRFLYAPGFFVLGGASAGIHSVRAAFVAELFPTEVRATLTSFVNAVIVGAGSVGLVVVGLLTEVPASTTIIGMAVLSTSALPLLAAVPEPRGRDVVFAEKSL